MLVLSHFSCVRLFAILWTIACHTQTKQNNILLKGHTALWLGKQTFKLWCPRNTGPQDHMHRDLRQKFARNSSPFYKQVLAEHQFCKWCFSVIMHHSWHTPVRHNWLNRKLVTTRSIKTQSSDCMQMEPGKYCRPVMRFYGSTWTLGSCVYESAFWFTSLLKRDNWIAVPKCCSPPDHENKILKVPSALPYDKQKNLLHYELSLKGILVLP